MTQVQKLAQLVLRTFNALAQLRKYALLGPCMMQIMKNVSSAKILKFVFMTKLVDQIWPKIVGAMAKILLISLQF